MIKQEKAAYDNILSKMEKRGCIDDGYRFCRDENGLVLLGRGGSSFVYEMEDTADPTIHYSAKVICTSDKSVDPQEIKNALDNQRIFFRISNYIQEPITVWIYGIKLDENGDVISAFIKKDNDDQDFDIIVQIIIFEKLEPIIAKDKFGNVSVIREDLKNESGVKEFAKQIGSAVLTLHENNYIHGDIKLENIFWDPKNGRYKLGDFDQSRQLNKIDATRIALTDGYAAPELRKQTFGIYDQTMDIYSFGVVLYLLLNDLKFPGSGRYQVNTVVQYSTGFNFPAPEHSTDEMSAIIHRMCAYELKDRYSDIKEVLYDIDNIGHKKINSILDVISSVSNSKNTTVARAETESYATQAITDPSETDDPFRVAADSLNRNYLKSRKNKRWDIEYGKKEKIKTNRRLTVYFAILFFLYFAALPEQQSYVKIWQFFVLPFALILEGFLQEKHTLNVSFGVITAAVCVIFMIKFHLYCLPAVLIAAVFTWQPYFSAGAGLGALLFAIRESVGGFGFLNFWSSHNLSWIILTVMILFSMLTLLFIVDDFYDQKMMLPILCIPLFFIAAGILISILFVKEVMPYEVYLVVERLHLIWAGLLALGVESFFTLKILL